MRFQVLGRLEVRRDGRPVALGGPRQRLVLAHLIIRANETVSADRLIDEVWGEEPPVSARGSLHSYVSHLKKALGADRLFSRPPGYVLRAAAEEIDASRFEMLVAQARWRATNDPAGAASALREALALWLGEPYADLANELSLQAEIARLSEARLAALEDRIQAELDFGRHAELIPELARLVARNPLRERLSGQLMVALYRAGRQAEALTAYQRLREALRDRLGLDPGTTIEAFQGQILNHDPALELRGQPLRGYLIVEPIGTGPHGVVHRAFEPQTGREVAIKVLGPRLANDADFVRRFEKEAKRVATIEHPNAVTLLDWWRQPESAYLVMPLLRGGNLTDRMARREITMHTAVQWAEQIGGALTAAHRQGVVHGDLRPGNVLFDANDNAYLADFVVGYDPSRAAAPERRVASVAADALAFVVLLRDLVACIAQADGGAQLRAALDSATARSSAERPPSVGEIAAAVRRVAQLTPTTAAASDEQLVPARNPYKGLRAFEESDAADFFGREQLVGQLIERMEASNPGARLLAIVGPSGSGKSSVISAGLIPALRSGAASGSENWFMAVMHPGERPFDQLEQALLSVALEAPPGSGALFEATAGLGPIVGGILPRGATLLLVIDQFEELFTLVPDESSRRRFLNLLAATVDDAAARVRLVITLRADFYDRPLRHERFGRQMAACTVAVPTLTPVELERAISEPAERAGLQLEVGLISRIVAEMSQHRGALPLLQYTLAELWEQRDGRFLSLDAYDARGGVAGAVSRRAEQIVRELDADDREAARQLFLRLVALGEGAADTVRRMPRGELMALAADRGRMEAVIDRFARYRLLLFDRDVENRQPTVELAHEALLRAWPRLQRWVDEARDDMRQHRRLAAAAFQWLEAGREPSFLLTGSRLDQVEQWTTGARVRLAPAEHEYLAAGMAEAGRVKAADERRRAHETELERRAISRLRALVVTLGLGALLAAALSVFAFSESERAAREARVASARELASAAVANLDVDPERSILLALEAVDRTRTVDGTVLPEAKGALHRAVIASRVLLSLRGAGGEVAWNPTGTMFVAEGPEGSGIIDIRDPSTGATLRSWHGHAGDVNQVAFNRDGSMLASSGDDGLLKVWNPATGEEIASVAGSAGGPVTGPSFSPDGSLVAAAWLDDGFVRILDLTNGQVAEIELTGRWQTSFSPDGARLAVTVTDPAREVVIVDVATGKEAFALEGHADFANGVAWSPDGASIATASWDQTARIWDAKSGNVRFTLHGHTGAVMSLDWSTDGNRLVTGSADGTAKVWQVSASGARELLSLTAQDMRAGVWGVAFSPDGSRVMTGAGGITPAVQVWDVTVAGGGQWGNYPVVSSTVSGVAFTPAGNLVTVDDGALRVWEPGSGEETLRTRLDGHVLRVAASPDGALLAGVGWDKATAWDAASGEELFSRRFPASTWGAPFGIAWSPDGMQLAVPAEGGILIVDREGREVVLLDDPGFEIWDLAFSPDGRLLAAARWYQARFDLDTSRVRIWDWRSGRIVLELPTAAVGIAFDRVGTRVATATAFDGQGQIWDLATGESLTTLAGHTGFLWAIDFAPDDATVATAGFDGTVRLWNADTGRQDLVLQGHKSVVFQAKFSPDGRMLASSSPDGIARVWALDLDDLVAMARRKLTRSLTDDECRQYLQLQACPAQMSQ